MIRTGFLRELTGWVPGFGHPVVVTVLLAVLGLPLGFALGLVGKLEAIATPLPLIVLFRLGEPGMRVGFYLFLMFFLDAFGLTLARLELAGVISTFILVGGLCSIGIILTSPKCMDLLNKCWPLLILPGLAFASCLWSVHPFGSFNRAVQLTFFILATIALVGRLGCAEALKLAIRVLSLLCILSFIWGAFIPEWGQHQATDKEQFVHAGLWRGVFTHKIQLGTLAGLTLGLLLFFGRSVFSTPIIYVISLIAAAGCLYKAGSATGLAGTVFFLAMLIFAYMMAFRGENLRRPLMRLLLFSLLVGFLVMFSGALDELVTLLGRSSDLTGRSTYWPFIFDYISQQGNILGYGYAQYWYVGTAIRLEAGMYLEEAHNGFIEMIVDFGYPGAIIIALIHLRFLWQSVNLLTKVPPGTEKLAVFPFALIATLLLSSYAESIILNYRGVWTMLLTIAVCICVAMRDEQRNIARTLMAMRSQEAELGLSTARPAGAGAVIWPGKPSDSDQAPNRAIGSPARDFRNR